MGVIIDACKVQGLRKHIYLILTNIKLENTFLNGSSLVVAQLPALTTSQSVSHCFCWLFSMFFLSVELWPLNLDFSEKVPIESCYSEANLHNLVMVILYESNSWGMFPL